MLMGRVSEEVIAVDDDGAKLAYMSPIEWNDKIGYISALGERKQ
jgi:hypothetical protein